MPRQTRTVILTCVYGLAAGVGTVAFMLAMNQLYQAAFVAMARQSKALFLAVSFLVIMGSSLVVGWLLSRFCPEAAGSGIPQLKLAFWKDFGFVPWRVAWVKFIAGMLSIGGGSSLGREGPSVQLAGAVSSHLGGLLGEAKQKRRTAAAAGAAAGLAAAFNTPLAAVTFVLEEIIQDLNSRLLGSVLLASVLGALVVHGLVGRQPSFTLSAFDAPSWPTYILTPVVAAVASAAGLLFQKFSLGLRARQKQMRLAPWLRPSIGAAITWVLGAGVFLATGRLGVFSLGYEDLSDALGGKLGWELAGVLLVTKLAATCACYGLGGCGGIFSPTLFFGAMVGTLVAGLVSLATPLAAPDITALTVVGMSACLGAVVRAPVTGILIVFEMTHDFGLVPVLMLGSLISQTVSHKFARHNFYDALLDQDGHHLVHVMPPRDLRGWQQLPVAAIANFAPVTAHALEAADVATLLRDCPYQRFPVVEQGRLQGILTRTEAELALAEQRPPKLEPAIYCPPTETVRGIQNLLISSASGMVVLVDPLEGKLLGLVTLHDLLRAEVSRAQESE